jgi:hypothetical protein
MDRRINGGIHKTPKENFLITKLEIISSKQVEGYLRGETEVKTKEKRAMLKEFTIQLENDVPIEDIKKN